MKEICEFVMLLCFGLSWPISVVKSLRSGSTKGKSPFFILAIIAGYAAGILGKLSGGPLNYVFLLYCFNFTVVTLDMIIFLKNRRAERRA